MFGAEIGGLVDGLTKLNKLDFASKHAVQAENFRKLLLAIADDARVLLIKLADRLHNMRTLHFVPAAKRARIAQDTLEIYAPLAGRMGMQGLRSELEELAFRYLMPEAYTLIMSRLEELKSQERRADRAHRRRIARTSSLAAASNAKCAGGRSRPIRSGARWSATRSRSSSSPTSTASASSSTRVEDCYAAVGVAHTTWPSVMGRFKDYISTPKQNDYRSIHTTVVGPGSQRVELQIRTHDMHEIAEYGIAAHALYKDGRSALDTGESGAYRSLRQIIEALSSDEFGQVPRAHQAGAVPGSGVLLHAEGPADRPAARRDRDRLRLRRPHRRRQFRGRLQDQRPHRAADLGAAQRRRGADHPLGEPHAARRLGLRRRHRPRPRRDQARDARGGEGAVRRPRPPDRRARLRARGAQVLRREAEERAAAPRARHRSTTCSSASAAARSIPPTWCARSIPISRRSGRRGRRSRRTRAAGSASPRPANWCSALPGQDRTRRLPLRGLDWDMPVQFRAQGRRGAGRAHRRHPHSRARASPSIPSIRPALVAFDDKPELWLDVRWDLDKAKKSLFPDPDPRHDAQRARRAGDGRHHHRRDRRQYRQLVIFNPTGPDFREIRFDLEVSDIQHLNAVIAQLRDRPVVSKVERISG